MKLSPLINTLVLLFIIPTADVKAIEPTLDISQYQGKVLYLDFWASWCTPCKKSFPWLNQLRKDYAEEDLAIVAINLDKDPQNAAQFLKNLPVNFPILYDPEGLLAKKYAIKGMPSSILFDRTGQPVIAHSGFFTKKIASYEQEIRDLVNTKAKTFSVK